MLSYKILRKREIVDIIERKGIENEREIERRKQEDVLMRGVMRSLEEDEIERKLEIKEKIENIDEEKMEKKEIKEI